MADVPHARLFVRPVRDESHGVVDFVCTEADAAASTLMGVTRAELLGNRLTTILPAAIGEELVARFRSVLDSGEPFTATGLPDPGASVDRQVTESNRTP